MKRGRAFSVLSLLLLIPLTLFLGTKISGRGYYLTSTLVIIETMLPFFRSFERRKPQARELVTIAVMCALAVASRVVVMLPHFKPTIAIIMLSGIALGPEAGFMTGSMAAFASNFFFSQGPWTPWQMMAYGFSGFAAGVFFHKRKRPRPGFLAAYAFVFVLLATGPLLDCCTLFTAASTLSWRFAGLVFAAGFPNNLQHGLACALTMLLFSRPLLDKLDRLSKKYGIMDI